MDRWLLCVARRKCVGQLPEGVLSTFWQEHPTLASELHPMAGRFKITPPGLTPRRSPNLQPRITSPSLDLYGPLAAVCGKKEMCGTAARGGTLYLLTRTSNVGLRIAPNGGPVQDNAPWPDPAALPKPPAKNNVAIPRSIWTAGCCVWQEGNVWDSCPRGDSLPSDRNIQRWPPNCTQWRAGSR